MKLKLIVLLVAIAPLFSDAHYAFTVAEPFEIRFSPANSVYRVSLNDDEELYDCVIQNIAVVNRTTAPVQLQRIEFQFLTKGEVVQNRRVAGSELDDRAQRIFTLNESGALKEAEREFRLRELFRDAQLSRSTRLEPGHGILLRHQYLQFS